MSRERDEFISILTRELPNLPTSTVIDAAKLLMRHVRSYSRIQEMICNGHPANSSPTLPIETINRLQAEHEAFCEQREQQLEKNINRAAAMIGCEVRLDGDPRGATVKLILPSGRSNSFGGVGWCVPNS